MPNFGFLICGIWEYHVVHVAFFGSTHVIMYAIPAVWVGQCPSVGLVFQDSLLRYMQCCRCWVRRKPKCWLCDD